VLAPIEVDLEVYVCRSASGSQPALPRLLAESFFLLRKRRHGKAKEYHSSFHGRAPCGLFANKLDARRTILVVAGKEMAGKAPRFPRHDCPKRSMRYA
jgi:hypothetical protein